MSRTPKSPIDYESQIQLLDGKIEKYKAYIVTLQEQRQAFITKQQEETMQELLSFMSQNNLTARDMIEQFSGNTAIAAGNLQMHSLEV